MKIINPPSVDYITGRINSENLVSKSTTVESLKGVFRDEGAYSKLDPKQAVYSVEMLPAGTQEGDLNFGASHIESGDVGGEFYMTRGHFHERIEQAEYYFGSAGEGLLIMQKVSGEVYIEKVFPGSVHHIPGHVAHRLVNTGAERLSALAVWPSIAGHNYGTLKEDGFNVRVYKEGDTFRVETIR